MKLALLGLAHGDAFGETLFGPPAEAARRVATRALVARRPWRWTDDTALPNLTANGMPVTKKFLDRRR